ncbi:uncharacterized protein LOC113502630 [Trichoplusia ni]|uniref:Uncharacterized protein LOC113502630 n=1 Tax=Trichoplusia ni TaxID=7111 RepID=A0A7E5WHC3_TRINI|nr:uncharacterized protein LOC113502630 [Trichoplusia ni]
MFIKILALLVLGAAAYCQDYYHHTSPLKTIVRHETPRWEQQNVYTEAIISAQTNGQYIGQQNYGHSSPKRTQSQITRGHDRIQPDIPNNYFEPTPTQEYGQADSSQNLNQIPSGHEQILNRVPEYLFVPAQNPAPVTETILNDTPVYHALRVQPVQQAPRVSYNQQVQNQNVGPHHGISHGGTSHYQSSHNVEYHIQH